MPPPTTTSRSGLACRLLDRAIKDYRVAVRDAEEPRRGDTALYDTEQRWDMVIQARKLLDEC